MDSDSTGSPPERFDAVRTLLGLITDPAACQARLEALGTAIGVASTAQARLAHAQSRFEAEGRAALEADRAALKAERTGAYGRTPSALPSTISQSRSGKELRRGRRRR
jgi:hypothetical protein